MPEDNVKGGGLERPFHAMTGRRRSAAILAISLIASAGPRFAAAQSHPYDVSNVKACQFMPTAGLEAAYGGKVTNPHGSDGDASVCTVNIGRLAVKLQSAPAGTAGVPTSIAQGLVGARMMQSEGKKAPKINTKDFGKVGCLTMKMRKGFDGKPLARPLLTTSCFLVEGGYLNLSVASENPKQVRFDLVREVLEKAAARR